MNKYILLCCVILLIDIVINVVCIRKLKKVERQAEDVDVFKTAKEKLDRCATCYNFYDGLTDFESSLCNGCDGKKNYKED